ncbi:MAG: helix-turn-helix transcriptional regulator [Bacteroidota bacterium]
MNRIDRLTSILLMLQSHRVITAEKIAKHFEISVRTVYRDLSALSETGVPIVSEAGVGYSLMKGYSIPPIMFTESEAASLFMSGEITDRFGDNSLKKSLDGALLKVRAALPAGHKNYLNSLASSMKVWGKAKGIEDSAALMSVQEAVVKKHSLLIQYNTGGIGQVTERKVDTLALLFYGQKWHLLAWCHLRSEIRDFRVDRIEQWKSLNQTHERQEDFSIRDYLDREIEAHALTQVEIQCEAWALDRIKQDMPGIVDSTDLQEDGTYLITARAYSQDWLACWLVGLGSSVIVQNPPSLKALVLKSALSIADLYQ